MSEYTQEDYAVIGEMMVLLFEHTTKLTILNFLKIRSNKEEDSHYFGFETDIQFQKEDGSWTQCYEVTTEDCECKSDNLKESLEALLEHIIDLKNQVKEDEGDDSVSDLERWNELTGDEIP